MMEIAEALRIVRRQADALARRHYDDAPILADAADTLDAALKGEDPLAERAGWARGEERFGAGVELARMELDTALWMLGEMRYHDAAICLRRARAALDPNAKTREG